VTINSIGYHTQKTATRQLYIYTVSQKNIPDVFSFSKLEKALTDFYNIWQKCY